MSKLKPPATVPVKKLNLQLFKFFRLIVQLAASIDNHELLVKLQLVGGNQCIWRTKGGLKPHFTT
jgi:hypothetical protein